MIIMKQKQILIILIVLIIAILACLTAYIFVNSNTGDYTTLRISNSCTIEVPNENNTMEHMNGGVSKYSFKSGNLNITHQKSANNSEIKSIYEEQIKNSKKIEDNIYHDETSGTYSIFIENKNTGDALLITSSDLNLLKKVSSSVKFKKAANMNINTNNTTDNSTETTDSDVASEDSASETNMQESQTSQQGYNQNSNNQNSNTPTQENTNNKESQKEESKYPSVIE